MSPRENSKRRKAAKRKKHPRVVPAPGTPHLLLKRDVLAIVGCTYVTLWKMMCEGRFPRSRVVGGKSAWLNEEVNAWMAEMPPRKLKGDA